MGQTQSSQLGTESINKLLVSQSVPASIGILVMSVYMIIDTIFVGQWVGSLAIAAITVVLPITFLISSVGMAIGVGGGSIISRSLGAGNPEKAAHTFGNQITMVVTLVIITVIPGFYFDDQILLLFGAQGDIMEPAREYYHIILAGVPFLAPAMAGNNVIRAQGFPKVAMNIMLVPAVINIILDPIFIYMLDWGLAGAAWATTISYVFSFAYAVYFLASSKSELRLKWEYLKLDFNIVNEINSLGMVTLARQGAVSILSIVLNHSLFKYGGEIYISVYGIINRILMFVLFPVIGLAQGMLPIAGYNYGAQDFSRVKEVIKKAIIYGSGIAIIIFVIIILGKDLMVNLFTNDPELLELTPPAILIVFLVTPFIPVQLIGAAYFQAIGKVTPALLLTLTRQGLFLIPLVYLLPNYFGIIGIWIAFPVSDILSAAVTLFALLRELKGLSIKSETIVPISK
ncbi:MATE family efflux transporter [bacterium SCSIO 12643]|nr:MATE family efflux transporter [bacterium SCSIO 12643]